MAGRPRRHTCRAVAADGRDPSAKIRALPGFHPISIAYPARPDRPDFAVAEYWSPSIRLRHEGGPATFPHIRKARVKVRFWTSTGKGHQLE